LSEQFFECSLAVVELVQCFKCAMPVAQIDEYKVLEIKTLGKARDAEARQLLERVAKQVQPIMRKRQWTVCKLSEFVPRSPNLLGLNVNRCDA
jgi:hypothetical protein